MLLKIVTQKLGFLVYRGYWGSIQRIKKISLSLVLLKIVTLFISPLNELHALSFYKPLILVSTYPSFRRARSGAHALGQYNRMCVYCSVLVRCSTHQVLNRFTMQVIVNLQIFNLLFTIFFFFNFSSFGPENSL